MEIVYRHGAYAFHAEKEGCDMDSELDRTFNPYARNEEFEAYLDEMDRLHELERLKGLPSEDDDAHSLSTPTGF
jgi:hypothetical protein